MGSTGIIYLICPCETGTFDRASQLQEPPRLPNVKKRWTHYTRWHLLPELSAPQVDDQIPQNLSFIARYRCSSRYQHSASFLWVIPNAGGEHWECL